jgi:hypothetical protein
MTGPHSPNQPGRTSRTTMRAALATHSPGHRVIRRAGGRAADRTRAVPCTNSRKGIRT